LASLDNVRTLKQHEADGVAGAIAGRAIYEGTLDFKAAVEAGKG
ncbi:MAG: 1-(5-phosphoribosyl)-5-((5-phosphoribosylamino)methylideneamino)imidazole-4-carboxamide isomerase, partial [Burkholderiales bacterium]|nr:1-(5-phosphoribosyl)-5-((5-phosphoribosylamino)methylideneamino)imidazole-4-carboxamide isomerase [Burkholderiales bacterium]